MHSLPILFQGAPRVVLARFAEEARPSQGARPSRGVRPCPSAGGRPSEEAHLHGQFFRLRIRKLRISGLDFWEISFGPNNFTP